MCRHIDYLARDRSALLSLADSEQEMEIVRDHIRAAAVPGAIEALARIVYLKSIKETNREEHDANKEEAWKQARAALRAVRGEESA